MSDSDNEAEALIELQTRIAFQEQALHEFNEVLTGQARELEQLRRTVQLLQGRIEQIVEELPLRGEREKPPHY